VRQEAIHILYYSLKDNVNAYELQEDGNYIKCEIEEGSEPLNVHQAFYDVTLDQVMATHLFEEEDLRIENKEKEKSATPTSDGADAEVAQQAEAGQ
jgi:polyphosphate kinase